MRQEGVRRHALYILYRTRRYACPVAAIIRDNLRLARDAPATKSIEYVTFARPYDTIYFLTNFDYLMKEIVFEQRLRVRTRSEIYVNWH